MESLPPLPESVIKIETLFAKGDPNIDDVVRIIESDPVLTTDILSKVNAPYYGFSKNIVSILQAVTLFGSTQIRSIVLSSALQRDFDIDLSPYNVSTSEFSKISAMQSELMFQWYMGIDIALARTITPLAFLMEIGKVLIAKEVIQNDKVEEFIDDLDKYDDVSYVENIYTMMSSAQINALIFKHLNLNDTFTDSMKYLDFEHEIPENMKEIVEALRIVRTVVNIKEQFTDNSIDNALTLLKKSPYNLDGFNRAVKRVKIKYFD